jgi:2-polyprenyl-3-methyl-5-hydroxy-6-metoxy-1,4-benzoquinol methylase
MKNKDKEVIKDFGKEWSRFSQGKNLTQEELVNIFNGYFNIFPSDNFFTDKSIGFDMGCGSGRWASLVALRVKKLICVDASEEALKVAKENLKNLSNCEYRCSTAEDFNVEDETMDFGYSLGVLHHVTNAEESLKNCVKKLKRGSPFLLYLYYKFDNRSFAFKSIWVLSNVLRFFICKLPFFLKKLITDLIAAIIYWPISRIAKLINFLGLDDSSVPLSFYKNSSFYTMRTDSLDRFGTKLEKRYTKKSMELLMSKCGLEDIKFSETEPFWVAVGFKS